MIESSNYSKGSTIVRIKAQIEKIIIHGIVTYREYFLVHDRYALHIILTTSFSQLRMVQCLMNFRPEMATVQSTVAIKYRLRLII